MIGASRASDGGGTPINVRAPSYAIASASAPCPRCENFTHVVALCLPTPHEVLEETWQSVPAPAVVFHIDAISAAVQSRLACVSPHFRPAQAAPGGQDRGWCNHCEHCGAEQSDDDLHCEPDGAFGPGDGEVRHGQCVLAITEPFEAAACGYSLDPGIL